MTFICVGTLEPRKNHRILLDAFELLWAKDSPFHLVLIGRVGWLCDDLLIRIQHHPELGRRLFWFNDVGDTDLALAYRQASSLIFPSIIEGFGLPLVEALGHGLSVIASDIPVFREIAGNHALYFPPHDANALADIVLFSASQSRHEKKQSTFRWPTWKESTRQAMKMLGTLAEGKSGAN